MKTLTPVGLQKIGQRFTESISHALCTLNGEEKRLPIYRSYADGDTIGVYVYYDDTFEGEIGNVRLVDVDGDVIAESGKAYSKPMELGFYVVFKYKFVEVEVETVAETGD